MRYCVNQLLDICGGDAGSQESLMEHTAIDASPAEDTLEHKSEIPFGFLGHADTAWVGRLLVACTD